MTADSQHTPEKLVAAARALLDVGRHSVACMRLPTGSACACGVTEAQINLGRVLDGFDPQAEAVRELVKAANNIVEEWKDFLGEGENPPDPFTWERLQEEPYLPALRSVLAKLEGV